MQKRLNKNIDFLNPKGLKKRVLKEMWKFVNGSFSDQNICTLQLHCDCGTSRELDKILMCDSREIVPSVITENPQNKQTNNGNHAHP